MTTATASKETAEIARPKRNKGPDLRLVDHDQAAEVVASSAPPVSLMVPAIHPDSDFRANQHRAKLDAEGEIALIDAREVHAHRVHMVALEAESAICEAEILAAIEKRDRHGEQLRQRREAERQEAIDQRARQERIIAGAEAALAATV